ncbi:MAG: nucleotidyl transferase AbiEii/AbiGii toxin family protein [Candidatus Aminicenantes bacterium]|nr:nucleotidyl transferase AbiEii/AbiGii toxin family protein [Candidatus Aminicenantes bacterium]
MKDYLRQLIEGKRGLFEKTCVVREYLHARILQTLQESGVFENWAFLGGTALRFLYGLPRYSEDLDFSLVDPGGEARFKKALKKVGSAFEAEGYEPKLKVNDRKTVSSAMIRFDGLLFELGLSPRRTQVLSVKVEVDKNPPAGATLETTLIRRYVVLNLLHHDRASLLSGKLHALLTRGYAKGRDLFDLVWYLADKSWPGPNLDLLNAALSQTGWTGERLTGGNWRRVIKDKATRIDWQGAREDVRPFLERENDIEIVTLENCLRLLERAPR